MTALAVPVARALLVVGLVVVTWASLARPEALPGGMLASDKVMHAAGYCFLGILAVLAGLRPWVAIGFLALFGFALEVAQLISGYRSFEALDAAADVLGVVAGVSATWLLTRGSRRVPTD